MTAQTLSIVVPTYNEKGNIGPLMRRIEAALAGFDWELLFVDDNSTDGTAREAYNLSLSHERVRLILRLSDRGLAKSSIQGMLSAKGQLLCVMDGDGQHDPVTIPDLVRRLEDEKLDVVSAARMLDTDVDPNALSPFRQRLSTLGNRLCNAVIGRPMSDPLTGFFIIRREAFLDSAPHLGDAGFKLLLDILYSEKSLRHGEVPFRFAERISGESKLDASVVWRFATFLISKMTRGLVPASLISFLGVGASGVFVHFAVLYAAFFVAADFLMAQIIATLTAATSNFFLNNLLTFRDRRLRGWRQVSGYIKFLLVSSVGIVANVSAATITYERVVHIVFVATLAGIAIDTVWKFVVANRFIWK